MKNEMSKKRNGSSQPLQGADAIRQIEKRAHELWLAGSFHHGSALHHWLEAEREVKCPTFNKHRTPLIRAFHEKIHPCGERNTSDVRN